jgi:hypothetical protein
MNLPGDPEGANGDPLTSEERTRSDFVRALVQNRSQELSASKGVGIGEEGICSGKKLRGGGVPSHCASACAGYLQKSSHGQ